MLKTRQKLQNTGKGCAACTRQNCPNAGKSPQVGSARSFFAGPMQGAPVAPSPRELSVASGGFT